MIVKRILAVTQFKWNQSPEVRPSFSEEKEAKRLCSCGRLNRDCR
jgi:hypothetical protein